ncbi:hypothetical protein BGX28_003676 [Mortierella sp. GBA30]|nr:hypothetical protein BGX28_003676 [Mortierella sp. GBA30]
MLRCSDEFFIFLLQLWRRLFLKCQFIFPRGLSYSETATQEYFPRRTTVATHTLRKRKRSHTATHPPRQETQYTEGYDNFHQYQCWKALYKLNYNWVMGQARVTRLSVDELFKQDQKALGAWRDASVSEDDRIETSRGRAHSLIVQFKGSVLLTQLPHERARVTCLSMDVSTTTATGWQKVMVGYESGHFSIFEYPVQEGRCGNNSTDTESIREIGRTQDLQAWSDVGSIQSAAFRYPIVATCSSGGVLSIYRVVAVAASAQGPRSPHAQPWCVLMHRLYGTETRSPVQLELERIATSGSHAKVDGLEKSRWRALVSFGLELYDGSWTVRLQEIEFDEHAILHSAETGTQDDDIDLRDSAGAGADEGYDSPFPSFFQPTNAESEPSDCLPAVGHGRIGSISAISIAWPLVVTTHSDNTMNVFQMAHNKDRDKGKGAATREIFGFEHYSRNKGIRFQHLSTLYGHCGAVSSVSIESGSGRLVSASMDRSIKVWTMTVKNQEDRVEQQRVHQCSVSMSDINNSWTESGRVTKEEGLGLVWVGSDEEKIVSMNCDGTIKVWQFS